jgi:hypothetical protein
MAFAASCGTDVVVEIRTSTNATGEGGLWTCELGDGPHQATAQRDAFVAKLSAGVAGGS